MLDASKYMEMTQPNLPPGSFGEPMVGEVREFIEDPKEFAWRRYRAFGPVFKTFLGAPLVLFAGPEANRFVLHDGGKYLSVAKAWPKYVRIMFGEDTYSLKDGEPMRRLKSLTAGAFHPDMLERTTSTIVSTAGTYLERWCAMDEVKMFPEARMLVFEAIWEWLAGPQPSAEATEATKRLYRTFTAVPEARIQGRGRQNTPDAREATKRQVWAKLVAKSKLEEILKGVIARRRLTASDDVMSIWLAAHDKDGVGVTESEMISQALMFTVAGGDATASALTWLVFALNEHRDVRERLHAELDSVIGGSSFEFGHHKQLPYLSCVIKELERFYSPAFGSVRKVVTPFEFNGYTIPADWNLRLCNFVSHRLPEVFDDPDVFDPDRFGPGREEDKRTPYSLVGFGAGQRQCSGKPYALLFLAALAVKLVQEYEWTIVEGQDLTPILYNRAVFIPRDDLVVKFRRRRRSGGPEESGGRATE